MNENPPTAGCPAQPARFARRLTLLAALAVLLRLVVVLAVPTQPISDFWSYVSRAQHIVQRGEYAAFDGAPDANFPPAYPLAIALPIAAGVPPIAAAKAVNLACTAASVVLFGELAKLWFAAPAGYAAAGLAALHPRLVLLPTLAASENLFLPLLLAWLHAASRWLHSGRRTWAWLAGAFLGLATLTRSVAVALWLPLLVTSLALRRRGRAVAAGLLAILLAAAAVMMPWWLRNGVQLGLWSPLSTSAGINLFMGNNAAATGRYLPAWKEALEAVDPGAASAGVAERHRRATRAALAWILAHPGDAASLYVRKLVDLVTNGNQALVHFAVTGADPHLPPGGVEVLPRDHWLRRHAKPLLHLLNAASLAIVVAALAGLAVAAARARRGEREALAGALLAASTALYFPLLSAVFLALVRYRWPAEDVLLLLAAPALAGLVGALSRWRSRSVGGPQGLAGR